MEGRFTQNPAGIDNSAFEMQEGRDVVSTELRNLGNSLVGETTVNKRKKSLVQLTKEALEALPRLENYRNSRRAVKRPSLGELHGGEDNLKDRRISNVDRPNQDNPTSEHVGIKLGWIQGVLIPCLLNIFGVMLFLRLSWVVAEAGIGQSLIIIGLSAVVCIITTLSLSAISTNGEVKGGGIYYIISRSLGPEFGASVGIVFAFANSVSASMNTIGFCNSLSQLLGSYGITFIDGGINDARVIGTLAILIMIAICAVGMEWEAKAQNFLVVAIAVAMVDFMVGTIIGPKSQKERAQGFTGFNSTTFSNNWGPDYRPSEGLQYDFFQVFAIFFPSVTGIQAGANISGDLKDPASAIPKGTLLALLISMLSYAAFVLFAGGAAIRDASGNVTDLALGTLANCTPNCTEGLFNNYQIMQDMSGWGPIIYMGCWAATLSTALTNLLSVPRIIQALGIDRIYPGLIFFSKGYGKAGEPYRGYILTFLVSAAFLIIGELFPIIGELNAIAPLISNFYLASYALINFCTFHAALIKPLGWRPTFKYYNTWLSLAGFIMCVVIMFLINWWSSLITFIVILALYLVVVYRKPDVNWGSSTQAQMYKTALTTAHRLINIGEHVKNYKPQILVLCGYPLHRQPLVDFANLITKNNSLLVIGDVVKEHLSHRSRSSRISNVYQWLNSSKIKGFYTILDHAKFEAGAEAMLQSAGIGKLSPNVLMMGYKNDWMTCSKEELCGYFNVLHAAFDYRLSVAILRLKDGLDCSRIMGDVDLHVSNESSLAQFPESAVNSLGPTTIMMHADSNLRLDELGKLDLVPAKKPTSGNQNQTNNNKNNLLVNSLRHAENNLVTANNEKNLTGVHQIPNFALEHMGTFRTKQNTGYIDVWWLYDDGGLTMLLPYIVSTRHNWSGCRLRIFALGTNKNEIEQEEKNMANLLLKFRLRYSSLKIVSLSERPQKTTIDFFNNLVKDLVVKDDQIGENDCRISESELKTLQDKTYRQLRLRELLLEHSSEANLIVMSLPMPRKGKLSAPLYMAWLEALTRDLPPYLLVRGNQQSVLTFYS